MSNSTSSWSAAKKFLGKIVQRMILLGILIIFCQIKLSRCGCIAKFFCAGYSFTENIYSLILLLYQGEKIYTLSRSGDRVHFHNRDQLRLVNNFFIPFPKKTTFNLNSMFCLESAYSSDMDILLE